MMDQIFDRTYQAGRAELNDGLDLLFKRIGSSIGNAFRVLNRIEYDSPWAERRHKRSRA